MKPVAIYDIETDQLGGPFVLGSIHYPISGKTEVYRAEREQDMVAALVGLDGEVWAHNAGRYDFLWLLDNLKDKVPIHAMSNGSGIVKATIGKAVFLDSYRLFPMTLAKLTAGAKKDISNLCICGKANCKGFCAVKRDSPERILKVIEEYCVADTVELANALSYFSSRASDWGLKPGITIGSTAWKSARIELGLLPAELPMNVWKQARLAYHGGRAEVFKTHSAKGFAYDVNSMYPFTLSTTPLPVGYESFSYGSAAKRAWLAGKPGLFGATVNVPRLQIPPLPISTKTGMAFPTGKINGAWARIELEYAESLGCKIEHFDFAVTFSHTEILFNSWVARLFDLRMKYGKDTREGAWIKGICNSLTGKLGSRNERHNLLLWPDTEDESFKMCECAKSSECECGAYKPIDTEARAFSNTVIMRKPEACAHVEWASYLTAAARVKLHKMLTVSDDAVYCDTDSCWCENERTEGIGKELGAWDDKGTYTDFVALGPKTYHAWLNGEEETAAKGIPRPDWYKILAGEPIVYNSIRGILRAKHGEKFFELIENHRTVKPNTGSRMPGPNGVTVAAHFGE